MQASIKGDKWAILNFIRGMDLTIKFKSPRNWNADSKLTNLENNIEELKSAFQDN